MVEFCFVFNDYDNILWTNNKWKGSTVSQFILNGYLHYSYMLFRMLNIFASWGAHNLINPLLYFLLNWYNAWIYIISNTINVLMKYYVMVYYSNQLDSHSNYFTFVTSFCQLHVFRLSFFIHAKIISIMNTCCQIRYNSMKYFDTTLFYRYLLRDILIEMPPFTYTCYKSKIYNTLTPMHNIDVHLPSQMFKFYLFICNVIIRFIYTLIYNHTYVAQKCSTNEGFSSISFICFAIYNSPCITKQDIFKYLHYLYFTPYVRLRQNKISYLIKVCDYLYLNISIIQSLQLSNNIIMLFYNCLTYIVTSYYISWRHYVVFCLFQPALFLYAHVTFYVCPYCGTMLIILSCEYSCNTLRKIELYMYNCFELYMLSNVNHEWIESEGRSHYFCKTNVSLITNTCISMEHYIYFITKNSKCPSNLIYIQNQYLLQCYRAPLGGNITGRYSIGCMYGYIYFYVIVYSCLVPLYMFLLIMYMGYKPMYICNALPYLCVSKYLLPVYIVFMYYYNNG